MKREYILPQVEGPDIRARLAGIEAELINRAIKKGIIREAKEARIRLLDATDFGKPTREFTHTFSAAHVWEKWADAVEVGDKIICIVGAYNYNANPKTNSIRFGVGVPVRPVFEANVDPMYVQQEPKVLFTDDVFYEKGDKVTIELYGTATGDDTLSLLGLVCEKA
jgi:hypothetical protein